jgi:hypothetical protein
MGCNIIAINIAIVKNFWVRKVEPPEGLEPTTG